MSNPSPATSFAFDSRELAETYDRLSDVQLETGKALVRHLGPLAGARVLDVGCGTGRLARFIAEMTGPSGSVVGVDPLPERVALARAHASEIRFEVGRAEDLGAFVDASFDAVCMSSVFHWVADKAKALDEVRRVLKPGGRFGLTTMARELNDVGTLMEVIRGVVRRAPYADRFGAADLDIARTGQTTTELISTVIERGLEIQEVHILPRRWRFASGHELVDFVESSSFGNFLHTVPDDLRDTLSADLAAAFEARKERDGIAVTAWMTLLVATRA